MQLMEGVMPSLPQSPGVDNAVEQAAGSEPQRKIIHCDADCFFAAIEMRDDPSLRGRPLAVGGSSDRRGVISTCNYEARAYGVRSAMPTATALRLCPGLLVVPHNMENYKKAAQQMRDIFFDYSELVEPLSLDEAFIDVSNTEACHGSATLIAREIKQRVLDTVGITVSAGVAPNKFLAKIGSDWNKPDGLWVITPDQVDGFVQQLPVSKIYGVGKVTAEKLHRHGINSCADLRAFDVFQLSERFGSFGPRLHDLSWGVDRRPVQTSRRRKSLSIEHTYAQDLPSVAVCLQKIPALFEDLQGRLEAFNSRPASSGSQIAKQFVKIKFSNFQSTTMECSGGGTPRITLFRQLFEQAVTRGEGLPVRLLGLGVRFREQAGQQLVQLPLFS
jgi:DNA polymerase-4